MSSEDEDVSFFNFGKDLVEPRDIKSSGTSSNDFDGLLTPSLKLHEDLAGGCGGQLWPAGMVLTKYMLRHPELIKGKTIIELGAGGGLVGLAVALADQKAFVAPLHITDQEPMLTLMQKNIKMNALDSVVEASIYDWGGTQPPNLPRHPDIILAADCVYFEPAFPLLQKTLQDLIGEHTICYFCFKRRRRADLHFVKAIKKLFTITEIEDDPDKPVYSRENLYLFKISKRRDR